MDSDSDYLTSSTTWEPLLSRNEDTIPHSNFYLGERDHMSSFSVLSSIEAAVTPLPNIDI